MHPVCFDACNIVLFSSSSGHDSQSCLLGILRQDY